MQYTNNFIRLKHSKALEITDGDVVTHAGDLILPFLPLIAQSCLPFE